MKFVIWYTNGKVSKVAEVITLASQEEADAYASDMDFEDKEYWAVPYDQCEQELGRYAANLSD